MSNKSEHSFLLSKWYIDLVDSKGNLLIIYVGRIDFGRLHINYSSVLKKLSKSKPEETYTLKKYLPPEITDTNFCWKSKDLGLTLKFSQQGGSFSKELISLPGGFIRWHCLHSRSFGEIFLSESEKYCGLGYVERLDMTIKPWKLPFNELKWGRFISDKNSAIWIEFKGEMKRSLILCNNNEYSDPVFIENKITFNSSSEAILFENTDDIKKGEIISSTFSKIPVINKILPSGLLKIFEHKSVAKAVLNSNGMPLDSGWAIFEEVKWL